MLIYSTLSKFYWFYSAASAIHMVCVQSTAKALRERSEKNEPHTCAFSFPKEQVIEEIAKPQLYNLANLVNIDGYTRSNTSIRVPFAIVCATCCCVSCVSCIPILKNPVCMAQTWEANGYIVYSRLE